jgi:glycosyltransferase involved in cell wall biosynthesis
MVRVSVVLATYRRAETLRRTLEHLAGQDLESSAYEVIVVDDGSPDHTRAVVEEFARTSPFALTYLHHANRGPGYTQNRGIRAAKAPLVLLMADDIWLTPGALRAHVQVHEQNPQPQVAVLGRVDQSPEVKGTVFLRNWDPFGYSDLRDARILPFTMFWACNISVKRDFLLENGLFSEEVGPGGPHHHHDVELGYRLHLHGLSILYGKEALGYHYHPCTRQDIMRQYYQRGLNFDLLRKQAPGPEVLILGRLLSLRTLPEVARALRRPGAGAGLEGSLAWHVTRWLVRSATFNRLTVPLFWEPAAERAETNRALALLMNRRVYRALMHYHFMRGIRDARAQAAPVQSPEAAPAAPAVGAR